MTRARAAAAAEAAAKAAAKAAEEEKKAEAEKLAAAIAVAAAAAEIAAAAVAKRVAIEREAEEAEAKRWESRGKMFGGGKFGSGQVQRLHHQAISSGSQFRGAVPRLTHSAASRNLNSLPLAVLLQGETQECEDDDREAERTRSDASAAVEAATTTNSLMHDAKQKEVNGEHVAALFPAAGSTAGSQPRDLCAGSDIPPQDPSLNLLSEHGDNVPTSTMAAGPLPLSWRQRVGEILLKNDGGALFAQAATS